MSAMLRALLIVTALAAGLHTVPAGAAERFQLAYAAAPQMRVTLDQAVTIARRQVEGRVVGAEPRARRGRIVHEVKILTDEGIVHVIRVDGETGRVSR
jgi:uncharacterized membrane protein YkoI